MKGVSAAVREEISGAMAQAGHGERTATARRLAAHFGVSVSTLYRVCRLGGSARPRKPRRPEYRGWTRLVVRLAHEAPKPVPLDLALEAAVESGALPPEASRMPVSTIHRVARELGLTVRRKRHNRMHADYPMQAVQIDGSSSEHLVVVEQIDEDDFLLRLHRRPYSAGGYKNKPLAAHRLRVLLYSLWDMCTGFTSARYCVAKGESALDAADFLCWSLAERDDPRIPFHGVPDDLWSDQGALFKSAASRGLLERLDINLCVGEPYAKERMGGVERTHRTRWARFERALFLRNSDTISLSELNARLAEFEIRENGRRASRTPAHGRRASRTAAWVALTNARETPLRKLPPNPIKTMAAEAARTVSAAGIVSWGGIEYHCKDWHGKPVVARRVLDGDDSEITLEDPATKERRLAKRYQARPYGDIAGVPLTPMDRLLEQPAEHGGADLYAPPTAAPTLASLPARSAPALPLDNPLDADSLGSLRAAMRLFLTEYPYPLSAENRAAVEQQITTASFSRRAVMALAQDLLSIPRQKGARK